jgi:hypothetical protein
VRYSDGGAFRQALEQRLKTRAGEYGARLARDRKRVAFDRLLARLGTVAPDCWLLKGGFALDLRLAERARATKDVDLDWQAAETELLDTLIEAAEWDAADFFSFNIERTGAPEDLLGGSHRSRVAATFGGRPFETFLLDIGFRSEPLTGIETLKTPGLLSFAGIEPVDCPGRSARAADRREAPRLHPDLRQQPHQHAHEGPRRPLPDRRALHARSRKAHGSNRHHLRGPHRRSAAVVPTASAEGVARSVPPPRPRRRHRR